MASFLMWGVHEKALGHPTPHPPNSVNIIQYGSQETHVVGITEFAHYVIGSLQLLCVKCSVLFFYRRIFCPHHKTSVFSLITIGSLIIVTLWAIGFLFATIFQCGTKFYSAWSTPLNYELNCPRVDKKNVAFGISDFIIDFWIVILPIPVIWKLHLNWKRKLALSFIFLLGLVAVGASFARMLVTIDAVLSISPTSDADLLVTQVEYWAMLESGLGLVACCLPTLRFLFGKWTPDNMLRSIRSMLSLDSLRSQESRRGERLPEGDTNSTGSRKPLSKPEHVLGVGGYYNETHAMRDLEGQKDSVMIPGKIHIKKSVSTEDETV
ncbi:MAG: hypothetical protein M1821_004055 [Bathelium mastoideum]|nr:MAG: hypothetical protein M1821_004055 [Bathelium mastoideum]